MSFRSTPRETVERILTDTDNMRPRDRVEYLETVADLLLSAADVERASCDFDDELHGVDAEAP